MKIVNSKKMKIILSSLSAIALLTPIVAVSAVACSSENKVLDNSKIVIGTEPTNQIVFLNQNENLPTFSVQATVNNKNAKLTYKWYENDHASTVNGKMISGASTSSYIIPESDAQKAGTKYFYVVVSANVNNSIVNSVISSISTLTIIDKIPEITITSEPTNQNVLINQTQNLPTFSVSATTNNTNQKLVYQWYSNTTNSNTNGAEIFGAINSSYTVTPTSISTTGTTYYYVKISGTINGIKLNPITSNTATLNVDPAPVIAITIQPTSQTVYANQTTNLPTFAVIASSTNANEKLSYQWYSNTTESKEGAKVVEGETSASYSIKQSDIGAAGSIKYYYVVVSGSINGTILSSVDSNIISLTTQPASTITITTEPIVSQIVTQNSSVSLSVVANSVAKNTLNYQWQKSNSNTADAVWTDLAEANAATYTFTEDNNYSNVTYYRVIITQDGTSATTTSAVAKVTVGYTTAQAQAQLNSWLAEPANQTNLLNSYFKTNDPLTIMSSSTAYNIRGFNVTTVPGVKDVLVTLATSGTNQTNSTNPLPFSTYKISLVTTSDGQYKTWNDDTGNWNTTTISIPVGTQISFYLPFGFKNESLTNNSNIKIDINFNLTLSNNVSSVSWSSPQSSTSGGTGTIDKIYTIFSGTTSTANPILGSNVPFQFPNYYTISNTNSDLPTYIIAS